MFWQRLWQWLNRPTTGSRIRQAPRCRARLLVEPLEDRAVPASFTAATVADLIGAINAANLTAEADTITLAPGKTFTLTAVNNTDNGATGLPTIAAGGGGLTIIGNGDIIERNTGGGTPAFRLLNVAVGASLTLQNLTLQGGYIYGGGYDSLYNADSSQGGAIYSAGTLTLTGVILQKNTAAGIDVGGGFGGFAEGGAIYSSGALTVQGSTIQNNLAVGGQGGPGESGGNAYGGGVYMAGGTATLTGTTITGNEAKAGRGGGGGTDYFGSKKGNVQGQDGFAFGGGLSAGGSVYLDSYTVNHIKNNKATTGAPDIYGAYTLLS